MVQGVIKREGFLRGIPVNPLFILMDQGDAAALRQLQEAVHLFRHALQQTILPRSLCGKKGEHADICAFHLLRDCKQLPQLFQLCLIGFFVRQVDFPDRRADGRELDALLEQGRFHILPK